MSAARHRGAERDRNAEHPRPTPARSGEFDNGNGSLMRILPIALVERDAVTRRSWTTPMRASRVTHGHPRAQVACALYVLVAARLLAGEGDRAQALADARPRSRRRSPTNPTTSRRSIISRRTGRGWARQRLGQPSGLRGTRSKAATPTARPSSAPSPTATTPTRPPPSPAASRASTGVSTASPRSGSRACAAARSSSRSSPGSRDLSIRYVSTPSTHAVPRLAGQGSPRHDLHTRQARSRSPVAIIGGTSPTTSAGCAAPTPSTRSSC